MSNFDEIKLKYPELIKALSNAVKNNRLAHAFIVQGDMAESRNKFASALAQIGCCPNKKENGEPCQVCNICRAIDSDNYADMVKVTPEGKAYQIKVGDVVNPGANTIRYFTDSFYFSKISSAERKVGIIYEADRMNSEAQNALLKTLEEPPKESLLILVTAKPKSLLPTTVSRCHLLTLMDKKLYFTFEHQGELFAALYDAFTANGDLVKLESAASKIIEIAENLKGEASEKVENEFLPKIEQAKEFDERLAKRLTQLMSDNAVGRYIGERLQFLSAIYCFYAQLALLAEGADFEKLPNNEVFDNLDVKNLEIPLEKALNAVKLVENLMYSFNFFVQEPLAIRNFIFNI
jgi:DNA polymerase III delta prime subunit